MRSLPMYFLKWLWFHSLISLAFGVSLIGNSIALKCHICTLDLCTVDDCHIVFTAFQEVLGTKVICHSVYDGERILKKDCAPGDVYIKYTGGEDSCADMYPSQLEKAKQEAKNLTENVTPEQQQQILDYIKAHQHQSQPTGQGQGRDIDWPESEPEPDLELPKMYRMCSCNTDSCNSDEEDDKRNERSKKSKTNGETSLMQTENCVVVVGVFLALEAIFWSQ